MLKRYKNMLVLTDKNGNSQLFFVYYQESKENHSISDSNMPAFVHGLQLYHLRRGSRHG
jgi:hypothetical protein